jgi:hypothetical protein
MADSKPPVQDSFNQTREFAGDAHDAEKWEKDSDNRLCGSGRGCGKAE